MLFKKALNERCCLPQIIPQQLDLQSYILGSHFDCFFSPSYKTCLSFTGSQNFLTILGPLQSLTSQYSTHPIRVTSCSIFAKWNLKVCLLETIFHWTHCNWTKVGAWLPVITKVKLARQMLVKRKRFIQMLHDLGEWKTPISKNISSPCHGKIQPFSARPRQKPVSRVPAPF